MSENLAALPVGYRTLETPEQRKEAVWVAARLAYHRYDGAAPDSRDMTRAEYVGREVLKVLHGGDDA